MSAIDQLKNGVVIDTTDGDDSAEVIAPQQSAVVIDSTTSDDSNDRVDLSGLVAGKGNHTTVLPKNSSNKQPIQQAPVRKTVNIDTVAEPEPEDPDVKTSYEADILDTENPNSMFRQYYDEKEAEAREWIAEQQEKAALEQEEKELEESNEELSGGSLVNEDLRESAQNNVNLSKMEDEDISSFLDEDEEDEDMEPEETDVYSDVEPAEDDWEDDVKEEEKKEVPKKPESYSAELDVEISDSNENFTEEIIEEDETANAEVDNNETLKHLQKLATEKLRPVSKSLDISSFTVVKKPVTNITPLFKESNARVSKWILPYQESVVMMKEFSGAELEKLRQYSEDRRSVDALNRRYHLIYDHIVSPKPASFEQWLKSTPLNDVDHYMFAIYISSFKGANYLPADCINKNCNETFLSDDIDIMSMVKFDSKEGKNKFLKLYQSEATPAGKGLYCSEVVPISNKVAISFRQPSIYNIFEITSIPDKASAKYSAILEYIPYIDTIYAIDEASRTLTPITYKMYPDNAQKTVLSKLQKYDNIFNTLGVDEFGIIKAYIAALTDKTVDMRYVYPAIECPKCHTMTEEQNTTAEEMVFIRYQLAALVTTSLS